MCQEWYQAVVGRVSWEVDSKTYFTVQHILLAVALGSKMWKRRKRCRKGREESEAGSVIPSVML